MSKINPRTPMITKAVVMADTVLVVGVFDGVAVEGGSNVGVLDETVVALMRLEDITLSTVVDEDKDTKGTDG